MVEETGSTRLYEKIPARERGMRALFSTGLLTTGAGLLYDTFSRAVYQLGWDNWGYTTTPGLFQMTFAEACTGLLLAVPGLYLLGKAVYDYKRACPE